MTPDQVRAEFEADFTVHDEVGCDAGADYDGPINMSRAPTGEPYVVITSGGLKREGHRTPAWYADPVEAAYAWLGEVRAYARDKGYQLYWRTPPELISQSFFAANQAELLSDPRRRDEIAVDLHYIYARLLVSTKDLSGREVDAR